MPDQPRGLYELLITEALHARLDALGDRWEVATEPLHAAAAPDRIALHLGRLIGRPHSTDRTARHLVRKLGDLSFHVELTETATASFLSRRSPSFR